MQDMISKIVEVDRQAREITEQAEEEKARVERELKERREKIRADYLGRARRRIKLNEETERAQAEQGLERQEARYAQAGEAMDALYAQRGDEWLEALVKRVLNPEN